MIHTECTNNTRIICVDDEEVMLETYRRILSGDESDVFAGILDDEKTVEQNSTGGRQSDRLQNFEVVLAQSGEDALAVIENELKNGRRFAAGFFDMRMPGGIDGYETIRQARKIDNHILCAVVTAYTDRSVEQIAELFTVHNQDELLYFNKPFRTEELKQTAVNMVCSWNRKRNEEEQVRVIEKNRLGLQCILDAISDLMWIPPRPLQALLSGILYQSLGLIDSEDGYIGILDEKERLMIEHALGKFKENENSVVSIRDNVIKEVLRDKVVFIENKRCVVPLVYSENRLGIIDMESQIEIEEEVEKNILETFGAQMVSLIRNSLFYDEIIKKEIQIMIDPLTGLFNRPSIYKILQNEFSRASRYSFSVAIIFVEINNIQSINKQYGEKTALLLVKDIGELLRRSVRKYDVVGRNVGGSPETDEYLIPFQEGGFSIILAQTAEIEAEKVADLISRSLREYSFVHDGSAVHFGFHIGFGVELLNRDKLKNKNCLSDIIEKAEKNIVRSQQVKQVD